MLSSALRGRISLPAVSQKWLVPRPSLVGIGTSRSIATLKFRDYAHLNNERTFTNKYLAQFIAVYDKELSRVVESGQMDAWSAIGLSDPTKFSSMINAALSTANKKTQYNTKIGEKIVLQLLDCASAANLKKLQEGKPASELLRLSNADSAKVLKAHLKLEAHDVSTFSGWLTVRCLNAVAELTVTDLYSI
jgi:hypothetical protein